MTFENKQTEFWESAFVEKQEMWGFEPSKSAIIARDLFEKHGVKDVLIPGIGYGRNAQVFRDSEMNVAGIEISRTAIAIAHKHYGQDIGIHHGSVTDMPFDNKQYNGIFCHALIHLLDEQERKKLVTDCYKQLANNGYMVFSVISKRAPIYGQGIEVSKDRYEMFGGVKIFFYDGESIITEFGDTGLVAVEEVEENYPFFLITCKKGS